jgi:UDP-N-acetylmuramoyl-tripeptide--D-alanyl-D-alanine ligase
VIPVTLAQIAALTGGVVVGTDDPDAVLVTGDVVTDSRAAQAGALYVARIGEHADGHAFIPSALANGAVAALVSRVAPDEVPQVVVDDVQAAFASLARWVIDTHSDLLVVGITGSSGKTSTKDLLGEVLRVTGPTIAPEGSFNSEVGVPLTVCRVRPETRNLVVEMGARGLGHIRYLTQIAPPRIGVVLNVGTAHMGEFGSREAIAVAKAELVEALPAHGVAVLNGDDPAVRAMAARTRAQVLLVGEAPDCVVRAEHVDLDDRGRPRFDLVTPEGQVPVALDLVGRHHVGNALAVAAVAREVGMSLADIAATLAAARPISRWRMEVTVRSDGVTVVNDAYNANPDSMRAALEALAGRWRPARRTWAVLGRCSNWVRPSEAEHEAVGAHRRAHRGGRTAGRRTGRARHRGRCHRMPRQWSVLGSPTQPTRHTELLEANRSGDVVLFKSSRDAGLRWLGEEVAARPQREGGS